MVVLLPVRVSLVRPWCMVESLALTWSTLPPPPPQARWSMVVLLMAVEVTRSTSLVPLVLSLLTWVRSMVVLLPHLRLSLLKLDKLNLLLLDMAACTMYLPERVPRSSL